eukprot:TRINITY_DN11221_c0_g1_i3.p1 TRINITY_DN11221_c0_g1~~TRINITY_DN11221_c0_g1_i3.p1  ORF type:complete len:116 (+),score=7.61 TRINITY_DN11221_c0_g1_i3:540-887(+)
MKARSLKFHHRCFVRISSRKFDGQFKNKPFIDSSRNTFDSCCPFEQVICRNLLKRIKNSQPPSGKADMSVRPDIMSDMSSDWSLLVTELLPWKGEADSRRAANIQKGGNEWILRP